MRHDEIADALPHALAVAYLRLWPRVPRAQQPLLDELALGYLGLRDDALLTLATGEDAHLRERLESLGEHVE